MNSGQSGRTLRGMQEEEGTQEMAILKECEGVAYKADLGYDGRTRFAKEQWHVSYDFTDP